MDLSLNARELEIQQRSRKLCDDVLLPLEIPCDEQDGLSPAELKDAYQAIIDAKLNAVNMREEWGGQGLSLFEQVLSQEQLGRSTNALWDIVWRPANVLKYCTPEQRERFLIPEIAGKRRSCYAITEENAGSDPSVLATKAVRKGDGTPRRRPDHDRSRARRGPHPGHQPRRSDNRRHRQPSRTTSRH